MSIPKRVQDRIQQNWRQFQQVLVAQKARDISEADTVTVVKDLLSSVFGYDKYAELTSEHSIRGTFCDLAVKIDGKLAFLIEVKAIGIGLKDAHIKQAIDYAANQGVEWVVLTNGIEWRLYHVLFQKPIEKQEVACFNILDLNTKKQEDLERLYLISREGFTKSALADYRDRKDATSRFMLGAIILHSDAVKSLIRREVRRISDISVDEEVIDRILRDEVIKRETIEGEHAQAAARRVSRSDKSAKRRSEKEETAPAPVVSTVEAAAIDVPVTV